MRSPVLRKTLRDSRLVAIGVGLALGLLVVATGWAIADQFGTLAERRQLAAQMRLLPPIFQGMLGEPIEIETLPGFVSWRIVAFLPLIIGLWSVVALAGTLAGEAARGTLEVVLATPISRRALALQKYAGHVLGIAAACLMTVLLAWLGSRIVGVLPGDEIGLGVALAEFALVGLVALFAGSIAFALAPLLGRAVAAGVGATYLFGSYLVNAYAGLVPGFEYLRPLSIFRWTEHHRPMAGVSDWPVMAVVLGCVVALAITGVVLFERRDLGATAALRPRGAARLPGLGRFAFGRWSLHGPLSRSLAERLPAAVVWGGGMGLYGLAIAMAADAFAEVVNAVPQMHDMIALLYPDFDFETVGGVVQLAVFGFMVLLVGLAAAMLVGGWAADERDGRLEMVLAAPLRRLTWVLRSGAALLLAVLLMGALVGIGPALGAAAQSDPFLPLLGGGVVLGLYAAALVGVALLVAGLGWPQHAAPLVVLLTFSFYLLDVIGGVMRLPADILNLSLNRHLGQPMIGSYDLPGLLFCALVAASGLLFAARTHARRDLIGRS